MDRVSSSDMPKFLEETIASLASDVEMARVEFASVVRELDRAGVPRVSDGEPLSVLTRVQLALRNGAR